MDRRVLIVAQSHLGHRLMYAKLLAQAVMERGDQPVLALTEEGVSSREFEIHLVPIAGRCNVTLLERIPLSSSSLRRLAREHKCTVMLVPDGDRFAIRLGLTGWRSETTVVVLVTQNPRWVTDREFTHRIRLGIKSLVLARTRHLPRTRLLYLSDHSKTDLKAGVIVAPDPVLFDASDRDPLELRRQLRLEEHRFWFLVAGNISPRKNLAMIIRSLTPLSGLGVALFVCGAIEPVVRNEISSLLPVAEALGIAIVLDDRIQSDHELNNAIQAADCVIVAYSSDQPTSMMGKAVRAGRRIVVAGSPSLQMWAGNLGIKLVGSLDEQSLRDLLTRAVSTAMPAPRPELDHVAFTEAFLCG